jgi:polyisoprenoid-binding protein YceI
MVDMTTNTNTITAPLVGSYTVDPDHSTFGFAVRHMGISTFRGAFTGVSAVVDADPSGLTLSGSVPVEGIDVRSPLDLRSHLLSEDFFDVARHPQILFASAAPAVLHEDGTLEVRGTLTMRNVSREVVATGTWTAPVEDPYGSVRAAIELRAVVDRRDFGMTWQMPLPKGGDALGAEVEITAHLELIAV